jgi:DNA modification methylase
MTQQVQPEIVAVPFIVTNPAAGPTTGAVSSVQTLQDLEAVIEGSLESYVEIGNALRAIRDGRLYKMGDLRQTFEQYCAERWSFPRQTAYDYIHASAVAQNVRTSVRTEPSLSQAVALKSLDRAQQRDVAEAIAAEGRSFQEVTISELRQVVQDVGRGRAALDAVRHFILKRPSGDPDWQAVTDFSTEPISRPGDSWILGDHRLFVGDATEKSAVMRLMGEDRADLVFTDPPYNVDYEGETEDHLRIEGDKMTPPEFIAFLEKAFISYARLCKPSTSMYVCHASRWQREFQNAIESAGFEVRNPIMWVKNTFALSFGRYKFQHEPIFYCYVAGQTDPWFGNNAQSTVWNFDKPSANHLHPTMKPVELIRLALANSSRVGDIVLDLFGGSGSTLIACEEDRRRARLMEIDPKYADVIVRRWQDYTGRQATLEGTRCTFDEIAETRLRKAA